MNKVISDKRIPIKVWASDLEPEAEQQLKNVAELPFVVDHVAAMPDAHAGTGSTIGTVYASRGAIIPSTVGVDIGCGMLAIKLPFKIDLFQDLPKLRHSIERSIPTGRHGHSEAVISPEEWETLGFNTLQLLGDNKHKNVLQKAQQQCGTLGGGNHFFEICQDQNNDAWIMLHSGSRNIGKTLAEMHIEKAKGLMKDFFITQYHKDLAFLPENTNEYDLYIKDLFWAQKFAFLNRETMAKLALEQVYRHLFKDEWSSKLNEDSSKFLKVNCHHNYVNREHHFGKNVLITRKGAISAKAGELGIIPGSMGTRSYIVEGLGNPDSFHSCSHGAGRKMSRTKAREMFNEEDLKKQTEGVECRKDKNLVDEIPGAYKDIDVVMENQKDLVKPIFQLKQILCIKGD